MIINLLLSVFSGLLTGLSFNFSILSFIAWFSLVPLIHIINKGRLKMSILSGVIFALCYYGVSIFWVNNVTSLGFVLLLLYLSLYYAFFVFLAGYFLDKPFRIISIPCVWVVCEFLKENIWCGFGWANLVYSQYRNFYLIQAADLLGAKFISFLIVMVNMLIWEIVFYLRPKEKGGVAKRSILKKAGFVFFVCFICYLYSFYRVGYSLPGTDREVRFAGGSGPERKIFQKGRNSDSLEVSVVQPNIPQYLKWEYSMRGWITNKLNTLIGKTDEDSLVILPEAVWPFSLNNDNLKELSQFVEGLERDVILGAVVEDKESFYNTALFFNKGGELIDSYRKIKLVPFGEYVPLRKLFSFISVINTIGDISKGHDYTVFPYKKRKFSVLICFEDIFPLHVLKLSRTNDFLVNITNDAWFGGEPEASQHLSIMTLRAVENRISIIRSSNTGISGWVSFKGEINKFRKDNRDLFFSGVKAFNISLNNKRSFYNKYGEFFPIVCIVFLLGIIVESRLRVKRGEVKEK